MAMVRIRDLALAMPLVFASGAYADPQLTHLRDNKYETTVGELIDNPSWLSKASLFVFNSINRGELSPTVRYAVVFREVLDPQDFAVEKVSFKLESDTPDPRIEAFNERIRMTKEGALAYLEANRGFLESISPDAVDTLKRSLADYSRMERSPPANLEFLELNRFVDPENTREHRDPNTRLADYIERTIIGRSPVSHFVEPEEETEANRFLDQGASRMGFKPIDKMSKKEAVKFLIASFTSSPNYRYRFYPSYDPISFSQFLRDGGNCTDYGWNPARAFNLMKGRNQLLGGMFWLPTSVYTYIGDQPLGHVMATVVDTTTKQATFVDFVGEKDGRNIRTLVLK